ncbi:PD-(D/E)XK nuclease family protein [Methylophilaceae bacterium]|nr:PD-(D/E)XK nuclease family protein [Methylophilaceae bacterium]
MLPKSTDTIICMTDSQVQDIKSLFKEKIEKKSIKIPPIHSIHRWLIKEYEEFCMVSESNENFSVLNGIEEKILWEKIIQKDLKEQKFQKKQIESITEKVISADKIIREHKIKNSELKDYEFSDEEKKFNKWLNQFKSHCKQKSLISKLSFIEFFIEKQIKHNIIKNEELLLVGFDNRNPLYENLINVLNKTNSLRDFEYKEEEIKRSQKIECEDVEDEIKEIIIWIKQNLKKRLLIISPGLSKYQIKLQNELDRQIQPDIYNEYNKKNIYNSNLQRPLSKEPIITAAINLLKLNNSHQTNSKNFFESLMFNNWIDADGYSDREQLANYINDKKIPKITINQIIKLIKNDVKVKHLNLNSLESTLILIRKNQILWGKKKTLAEWVSLTEQYWKEIKLFEINNLLSFENNNIYDLIKSLNQVSNNQIIEELSTFEEYLEILFTQLEGWPAPTEKYNSYIDINGFEENQIRKYDAIWLMNMNTNYYPGKRNFNPFIPKKLQKKYHIFDEVYTKKIDTIRLKRLKNLSTDITISYSTKDGETTLFPTSGYFDGLEPKKSSSKKNEIKSDDCEEIEDHIAPEILGSEISVSGGFRSLENYNVCPAWAFYENRLHASSFYEDIQDEISKMDRGNLIHKLLERFWKEYKNSTNLAKMTEKVLQQNIDTLINQVMLTFKGTKPYLTPRQIQLESNYFKNIAYQWLSFEKINRPSFKVIESEEKYKINIDRITFNVKIDRIDEYEDGSRLLIDYKTGNEESISKWTRLPISSLQMPIYITFTGINNISAAGIGYIYNRNVKLVGLSMYGQDPIDAELKDCSLSKKDEEQWPNLINSWHKEIHKLASGYLSGDVRVTFKKENDLKYCAVKPLLRLAERRFQLEKSDE